MHDLLLKELGLSAGMGAVEAHGGPGVIQPGLTELAGELRARANPGQGQAR